MSKNYSFQCPVKSYIWHMVNLQRAIKRQQGCTLQSHYRLKVPSFSPHSMCFRSLLTIRKLF